MKIHTHRFLFSLLLAIAASQSHATVIGFDDIQTRNNFGNMGISNTYMGYKWSSSGSSTDGWATATTSATISGPMSAPVSGQTIAWNWNGVQSLYIDFGKATDVNGAWFATGYNCGGCNASSITMLGYDAANKLVATSSSINPTFNFQYLNAGFTDIYRLELKADSNGKWFAVDSIEINASAVPEPASIALLALGLAGLAAARRRKQA